MLVVAVSDRLSWTILGQSAAMTQYIATSSLRWMKRSAPGSVPSSLNPSRSGIAHVRFKQAYRAYEVWLMRRDGSGKRLVARCCETKWYTTHVTIHGFATVALSADGNHLLACQPWEGGCYPVAIELPSGRRYAFPETRKLGTPEESASAVDLTRDGFRLGAVAARVHHDGRATLCQGQRDRATDIAAGAGDDSNLAREFFGHEPLPAQ